MITEKLVTAPIPSELLVCEPAPVSPGGTATQRDVATYLLGLYEAWEDCSGNLLTIKTILDAEQRKLSGKQ